MASSVAPSDQSVSNISVSGFAKSDRVFSQSVKDESARLLEKLNRYVPVRSLELRMKDSVHGKSKLFEVRVTARLDKGALYASASGRDLYFALRRAFAEIYGQASRSSGLKAGMRAKEAPREVGVE